MAADNRIFPLLCWIASMCCVDYKVSWGIGVPCMCLAYFVSRFTPGLWYYHTDTATINYGRMHWAEVLLLSGLFVFLFSLTRRGTLH